MAQAANQRGIVLLKTVAAQLEYNISWIDSVILDFPLSQGREEQLLLNPHPGAQYKHSHELFPPVFLHLWSQFQDDRRLASHL